ncbi:MAG: hypothetical protein Q8936_14220 [Bacillota bacterium]|nr:hypothetical protein [Bacillota bacterium]
MTELLDELQGLMCQFCVACRQDTMTHKEFLSYWHDKFAKEGYEILNKMYKVTR